MFIEKRKVKSGIKYYLVHSYRDVLGATRKIRKFLGSNLSKEELNTAKKRTTVEINAEIEDLLTQVFFFSLSEREKLKINSYSEKLKIIYLNEQEWQQFTEEFVYNTNAIEGSQVLEEEVHEVLKNPDPKNPDQLEAKGVQQAIEFMRKTKMDVSLELILKLHKLCFQKTKSFAGEFRKVEVVIRDSQGTIVHQGVLVKDLHEALQDLILWYQENKNKFTPLALAAIMHNQFEHIHPFQDGNGRVGRLLLNFILLKHNYPPVNILFKDRAEYYYTLHKYHSAQDMIPTMKFLISQYEQTYKVTTKKKK